MKFARVTVLVAMLLATLSGCIKYIPFDSDPHVLRGSWNINLTKSTRPQVCQKKIIWNSSSDKFIVDSVVPSIFNNNGNWLQSIKLKLTNTNDYNPFFYGYPYLYRDVYFMWQSIGNLIAQVSQINRNTLLFDSNTGAISGDSIKNPAKLPMVGISADFSKIALLSSQYYSEHAKTTVSIQNSFTGQEINTFSVFSNFGNIRFSPNLAYAIVNNNGNFEIWKVTTNELIASYGESALNDYLFDEVKNMLTSVQTLSNKTRSVRKLDLISKLETEILTFDASNDYLKLFPNYVVKNSNLPNPFEIWNLNSKTKILELPNLQESAIADVSISPNDQMVAVSRYDQQCSTKILALPSGNELKQLNWDQPANISGSLTFQASFVDQNQYPIAGSGTIEGIEAVTVSGIGYSMSNQAWTKSGTRAVGELFNADLQIMDSTGRIQLVSLPLPVSTLINQPVTPQNTRSRTQLQGEMLGAFGAWCIWCLVRRATDTNAVI
jgi:hypothetical protein